MEQTIIVEEITVSHTQNDESTSPEVISSDDIKWLEEVSKKFDDADSIIDVIELESTYENWFKSQPKNIFPWRFDTEFDYENDPAFQEYLKKFE